jgi:proline iminopeptidase
VAGTALADAPPVVFLHGGPGQGSQSFASLIGSQLEPSLQMIYYDQRGSGRSERPYNREYSIPILVKDIENLRRELGVRQINIIGQSFGGVLALEYAATYPQHVNKMVVAAGLSDAPWSMREMCKHLLEIDTDAHARAVTSGGADGCNPFAAYKGSKKEAFFARNMFPNDAIRKKLEAADTADGLRNTGEIGKALFSQNLLKYRFEAHEKLTMPVLVIAGELDFQIGLAPQQDIARRLPNATFLLYKNAGHFMYLDAPDLFVRDVVAFFTEE